jgi:hypothetical protein
VISVKATLMKEKVYLDSTVPSYYFDDRHALVAFTEVTRKWWSEMSCHYDLYISDYFDIQYLLTWNCNHLANANKRKHIRVINARLGLSTPEIVTPLELFTEENNV